MKFSILIFVSLFTLSCNSVNQPKSDDFVASKNDSKIYIGTDSLYLIGKLEKHFNENIEPLPKAKKNECENWNLTNENLEGLLSSMKMVTNEERYARCYHPFCYFTSKVKNTQHEYDLTICSNSSVELSNSDTTLIFILEKPSELFLTSCDCCE